jgi:hypothetical protein
MKFLKALYDMIKVHKKKNWLRDIGYLWISCGLKKFQSHMKMSHQEETYKRLKGKKIRNIVELMGWDVLKGRKFINI